MELNFDLELQEIPVTIGKNKYVLRECSSDVAVRFKNERMKFASLIKDSSSEGLANLEPLLVSLCLFDSSNNPVPLKVVEKFASRIVSTLYDKCIEINLFNEHRVSLASLLRKALSREDSPVSFDNFCNWANTLPEEYEELLKFFKLGDYLKN